MDLICREAVKEKFPLMENGFGLINEGLHKGIDELPSAFEGKTNGEVIISLYPNLKYTIRNGRVVTTIGVASSFDLDWWNTPYKGVSE